MECWNTIIAHLAIVSVAEWMEVVVYVIMCITMMTMTASVSVIEKVCVLSCMSCFITGCQGHSQDFLEGGSDLKCMECLWGKTWVLPLNHV